MQNRVYEQMERAGYQLVANEWENNDHTQANHMVLEGPAGEKIAVSIIPKGEGEHAGNTIDLAFQDPRCNEEERRAKVEAITNALCDAYGLPRDQLQFMPKQGSSWQENAPDERFDPVRLRQEGAT
jgi:hypothetical protein